MIQVLIFLIGGIVGAVIVWASIGNRQNSRGQEGPSSSEKGAVGLIEQQAEEKRRNKERILGLLAKQEKLTNDDVEKLLSVSDATAERYLQELEEEGLAKQVGATGQGVFYTRVN